MLSVFRMSFAEDDEPTLEDAYSDPWFIKLCNAMLSSMNAQLAKTKCHITQEAFDELIELVFEEIYLPVQGWAVEEQTDPNEKAQPLAAPKGTVQRVAGAAKKGKKKAEPAEEEEEEEEEDEEDEEEEEEEEKPKKKKAPAKKKAAAAPKKKKAAPSKKKATKA